MAENQEQSTTDMLRQEISSLKQQLENIIKTGQAHKSELKEDIIDKLSKELENLRQYTSDRAHKIYESGHTGACEVGEHVRNNPLASLLIAFGAGCVVSCLFRHLK